MDDPFAGLVGTSPVMEPLRDQLRRLAAWRDAGRRLPAILLHGETGTGKGLLARLIHQAGPRRLGPFVDVNCAAIPEPLLEAELFGFERGAFTDARRAKPGLFQTAHRGVLFLDEIALLPEPLQAKLLKVLEDQAVRRLGATHPEPADVWIISATNADLAAAIRAHRFREDLYHRLAVITLALPPLRARADDVTALAEMFLQRACADYDLGPKALTPQARQRLRTYAWPGNVRELANVMERTALLADGVDITAEALALDVDVPTAAPAAPEPPAAPGPLEEAIRQHLLTALEQTRWNISRTAEALGISRNTVRARIERFGLRTGRTARALVKPRRDEPRPVAAAEPPAAPVRWERRRITVMRVLVQGAADPEEWPDHSRALDVVIDKIQSFGGRVEEMSPRTVEASFGLSAIEDAPRRATHVAMAVIRAGARGDRHGREAFAASIGIHTAQVLVSQVGGALQADQDAKREASAVLEALAAAAGPGEILVSPGTAPFLERRFELLPLAEGTGVAGYRLTGTERRGLGPHGRISPFVGRTADLELLRSRLASASRGRGQVVAVVGDAGVGKSRLVWELLHGEGLSDWLTLETGCVSYGAGTPYLPVVQLIRTYCRIAPDDGPGEAQDSIVKRLQALGAGLEAYAPALLALLDPEHPEWLGLEPAERRQRTLDAIKRVLVRESQIQPVLLVVEDLHWVDSETQALLDTLVESLPAARIVLVVSSRPEYEHGWGTRSYYTHLRVQPLPPQNSEQLLATLLGGHGSLAPLVARLTEWTEGNPFFLEESVQALVETGAITGEPGAYRLAGPLPAAPVPATVEEVLAARIGRLPTETRTLLQAAAAMGKDFPLALLAATAQLPEPALRASLAQLQAGEFIYEAGGGPRVEFTFKHALTQQVAYESLPLERRRELHARILSALEALPPEQALEQVDRLADHAVRGEVWERALHYLTQAGHRALKRSASREAALCFTRALDVLPQLPQGVERLRRAIDLRFDLRTALLPLAELDRILGHLQEAEALAVELEDPHRLGQLLVYMTGQRYLMGAYADALEYGRRALAITESGQDFNLSISTHTYLGQVHHARGAYREAVPLFKHNVDVLVGDLAHERFGLPQLPSVHSRTCLVWSLAELGEFAEGAARGQEAIEIAQAADQPLSLTVALSGPGFLYVRQGDLARAVPLLERAVELSQTWSIPLWFPRVASALGLAHAMAGRHAEALVLLEAAVEQSAAMRLQGGHSLLLTCLAEGHLLAGRTDRALDVAAGALDLARRHQERGYEAWALRLSAEALRLSEPGRHDEARGRAEEALALAETLGMRPLAAQCRLELGRAGRARGSDDKALGHLEAARAGFAQLGMAHHRELVEAELRSG